MNIVVLSSNSRCGIYEYSQILIEGLKQLGHSVRYIGTAPHDNQDLVQKVRLVAPDDDMVIIEYEPGIFWLFGMVKALLWLRLRRPARILFSIHEIEPQKYPEYRQTRWHFGRAVEDRWWLEFLKLGWGASEMILRFLTMRIGLLLMGALPHTIIVHSEQAAKNLKIMLADREKTGTVLHVIQTTDSSREEARQMLSIEENTFAFICPGFLFRRKRLLDVAEALPDGAEFWIVGTVSEHEPDYLADLEKYLAHNAPHRQIRLIQDYDNMPHYLMAADVAVLYYETAYQSGAAALAIGAGKPCIFTKLPAFEYLGKGGLFVQTFTELRLAMVDIQQPDLYNKLVQGAKELQQQYSPEAIAAEYLEL